MGFPDRGLVAFDLEPGHLGEVGACVVWTLFHGRDMEPGETGRDTSASIDPADSSSRICFQGFRIGMFAYDFVEGAGWFKGIVAAR